MVALFPPRCAIARFALLQHSARAATYHRLTTLRARSRRQRCRLPSAVCAPVCRALRAPLPTAILLRWRAPYALSALRLARARARASPYGGGKTAPAPPACARALYRLRALLLSPDLAAPARGISLLPYLCWLRALPRGDVYITTAALARHALLSIFLLRSAHLPLRATYGGCDMARAACLQPAR